MSDLILTHLLTQIYAIINKHEGILKLSGENYNIFRILQMGSSEVRLHSAFIADLLNPKGNHGQDGAFLEIFLKPYGITHMNSQTTTVEPEVDIGVITETEGGRIDILVEDDKKNHVIIENKIYAADQPNQLLRYHNYDKKAPLFYLTLDGREPTAESCANDKNLLNNIICISYSKDIIEWLEQCKKEAVDLPILRETIVQYIQLVKYLTNQSRKQLMSKEIANQILQSEETLTAYFEAINAIEPVLNEIFKRLQGQLSKLDDEDIKLQGYNVKRTEKKTGFKFHSKQLEEMNIEIAFEFGGNYSNYFYFGYRWIDQQKRNDKLAQSLFTEFGKRFKGGKPEEDWLAWANWNEYFNQDEKFILVYNGIFCKAVKEKVAELIEIALLAGRNC